MPDALPTALRVAFRATDTTEDERDAILAAMAEHLSGEEGETASRALHHRREAAALQMNLFKLINQRRAS